MSELDVYDSFAEKMAEKYPRYFGEGQRYGGFAIGSGWHHIIEELIADINSHTKWRRDMRARDLIKSRARKKGIEALIKFHQGKSANPSDWNIECAQNDFEHGIEITPKVNWIRVEQIKEKFGGLRFYYQGGDDVIDGMVRMAESWAGRTCETCGNKGERRGGGWIRTLCDEHESEYQQRTKERA
jgi:hypothetical protein